MSNLHGLKYLFMVSYLADEQVQHEAYYSTLEVHLSSKTMAQKYQLNKCELILIVHH